MSILGSPVGSEDVAFQTRKLCSVGFFSQFSVASTGGAVEPGEENGGGLQDLLPAPLPRRPPLLPEVQVCQSRGGSGEHTSHLFRKRFMSSPADSNLVDQGPTTPTFHEPTVTALQSSG